MPDAPSKRFQLRAVASLMIVSLVLLARFRWNQLYVELRLTCQSSKPQSAS